MTPDTTGPLPRILLALALLAWAAAAAWSWQTPPAANADRYDYAGRAWNATQGRGLRPLVVYPLRFAFGESDPWPANFTRPPAWPAALVPLVAMGLDHRAGVLLALLLGATVIVVLARRPHKWGSAAGPWAALVFATSFAAVRGLWGGGPELLLALLLLVLFLWNPPPRSRRGLVGYGALGGLLPLVHPLGWMWLALTLALRILVRPGGLPWIAAVALAVGLPWYAGQWLRYGSPLLQASAELARSLEDPGGLGPYREMTPRPGLEVLQLHSTELLRLAVHRVREFLEHLDGWLAWPGVILGAVGLIRRGTSAFPALAAAAAALVGASIWSAEVRLLLPVLPLACLVSGEGFAVLVGRWPRAVAAAALVTVALPWALPLSTTPRPADEAGAQPRWQREPSAELIRAVRAATAQPNIAIVTDSAALAWHARRRAVFLPATPGTLAQLRQHPTLAGVDVLALHAGRNSQWTARSQASWDAAWARSVALFEAGSGGCVLRWRPLEHSAAAESTRAGRLPDEMLSSETTAQASGTETEESFPLAASYVPADLVALSLPPATREGLFLRKDAAAALNRMVKAARREGLQLRVVSAYRSYARQKTLYQNAVRRHGADQRWVARPGESEHQLGTAMDLADGALQAVVDSSFGETAEGRWVATHGHRFGFTLSYTQENTLESGYLPEPWHVRYRPEPKSSSETRSGGTRP